MPFQGWWKEVQSGWQAELHTEKWRKGEEGYVVRKKAGEKYQQGSKAEGRWDPEGKCYLAQKQSCA